MKIAITGASGFVGQQLVPLLVQRGAELLLVGRNTEQLSRLFPGLAVSDYARLNQAAVGFDTFLHLAVVNNDTDAASSDLKRANVELPEQLCRQARDMGVRNFVFFSSTHALNDTNTSAYAASKRQAVERISAIDGIDRWVLYLPAVIGDGAFSGKLAFLGRLPAVLRNLAWPVARSLKPSVSDQTIVDALFDLEPLDGTLRQRLVSDGQRGNKVYSRLKRFIDVGFAVTVVVLLWWAMLAIWLAIKLQSPGPGIFRQQRIGRNEEIFTCLKFRTMYITAPNVGTHEVPVAAVTRLGHFLRKTKLDELPQVINLLRNDMSLVGPRPCLPTQIDMVQQRRVQHVFDIKPGITGLAQIRGIDMSDPEDLAACDREYLQLQSLLLDVRIILQTALGAGSGDKIKHTASESTPPLS